MTLRPGLRAGKYAPSFCGTERTPRAAAWRLLNGELDGGAFGGAGGVGGDRAELVAGHRGGGVAEGEGGGGGAGDVGAIGQIRPGRAVVR